MVVGRQLTESEKAWAKRYHFLETKGYRLRPRYRPGWKPSWIGEDGTEDISAATSVEDSILITRAFMLDAERISDAKFVILKHVEANSPEISIGQYLSQPDIKSLPQNHSIPLLDVLTDPTDPDHAILVFPLLRPINFPRFATVGECTEFINQALEGLNFLHEHDIAHRDCATANIMMDARLMFPNGWHAMNMARMPNGETSDRGITRTEAGNVRYYFIDFGLSSKGKHSVLGQDGIERAPELERGDEVPYDPFKLDIYMLGMTFKNCILDFTRGAEFIVQPIVKFMLIKEPDQRHTSKECMAYFQTLTRSLSPREKARRLRPYARETENTLQRHMFDTLNYVANLRRKPLSPPKEIPPLDPFH